jgi:integrase
MTFYRRKVNEEQTHKLSADTLRAMQAYLAHDMASAAPATQLLMGIRKDGSLAGGMSTRAIRMRVRLLGEQVGIEALSPHDCRHYWATYWAPRISLPQLQKAGGWSSPAMPLHYARAAEIANEGMA